MSKKIWVKFGLSRVKIGEVQNLPYIYLITPNWAALGPKWAGVRPNPYYPKLIPYSRWHMMTFEKIRDFGLSKLDTLLKIIILKPLSIQHCCCWEIGMNLFTVVSSPFARGYLLAFSHNLSGFENTHKKWGSWGVSHGNSLQFLWS